MPENQTASYIGWSLAAMNFRRIMSERAVAPVSLLIVGEPGTGKRTMAEAWQRASGAKDLPIINLDDSSTEIQERCIAISTRPIQTRVAEFQPINLKSLRLTPDCQLQGEPISESHLTRFAIKLLVPPLRERRMDILAVLHSYADQPPLRDQPSFINSQLIYRMFLDAIWTGNLRTLTDCLIMASISASKSSGPIIIGEGNLKIIPSTEPLTYPTDFVPPLQQTVTGRNAERIELPPWCCDDVDVPLDQLPFVTISILLDAFWKSLEDPEFNPELIYRLGNDSGWVNDFRFEDTTSATLASSSVLELFEQSFWGLKLDDDDEKNVIPKLEHFVAYGATIESLQEGFRVSGGTISKIVKQETKKKKSKRKPLKIPTDKQLKVVSLVDLSDMTFRRAAEEMGLGSRQAAQQLYKRAKETMHGSHAGSGKRAKLKIARDKDMKRIQYDPEKKNNIG